MDAKLLNMRKGQAKLRVVADRGLQQGDLAIVDFSAARVDTGEELVGAARQSMRLDTYDADTTFLPGGWLMAGRALGVCLPACACVMFECGQARGQGPPSGTAPLLGLRSDVLTHPCPCP